MQSSHYLKKDETGSLSCPQAGKRHTEDCKALAIARNETRVTEEENTETSAALNL
jgi:hypothetical protein